VAQFRRIFLIKTDFAAAWLLFRNYRISSSAASNRPCANISQALKRTLKRIDCTIERQSKNAKARFSTVLAAARARRRCVVTNRYLYYGTINPRYISRWRNTLGRFVRSRFDHDPAVRLSSARRDTVIQPAID